MQNKFKIPLIFYITAILSSCMYFMHDGSIDSPQSSTWVCTINTDGTGLHYLYESRGDVKFNSDGSKIIIGNRSGFKIIDSEIGTLLVDIDTLSTLSHYTLSNDNAICFSASSDLTSSKDLFIYEPIISSITNITMTDSIHENAPSFSENGDKILFIQLDVAGLSGILKTYNINTQQFQTVTIEELGFKYPQFTSNDSLIVFSTYYSYNLFNVNDQTNTVIFEGNPEHYPCSILANEMVFSADGHICKMNIDGSELIDLGEGHHPSFSPDGSKIVFDGLSIMNSDGTGKQTLTDENGEYPHFSPDGSKIVFIMERYEE